MGVLELFSATSVSGAVLYVTGFVFAIYVNLKVYKLDPKE